MNILLDDVNKKDSQSPFWALRGHAINSYAKVEQSLYMLLAVAGDMPPDVAALVFFRMVNTRSRMVVLEKLLQRKFQKTYSLFWNSVAKQIETIDRQRNGIVHWHVKTTIHISGDSYESNLSLTPPNVWESNENTENIDENGLYDFIKKSTVFSGICSSFMIYLSNPAFRDSAQGQALRGIFLQPLTYPLPDTHPLSQNWKAPESPPPPSAQ